VNGKEVTLEFSPELTMDQVTNIVASDLKSGRNCKIVDGQNATSHIKEFIITDKVASYQIRETNR
jgi:hypothetical protein